MESLKIDVDPKPSSTLIIEDTKVDDTIQEKSPEVKLKVGDIIWAKMFKYPYWPGIICVNPETNIFMKGESPGKKEFSIHVRFCNDNGRRCWVKTIEEFNGKDEFLLKHPKFLVCFKHNKRLEKQWQKAVTEAIHWLTIERSDRLIQFFKANRIQMDVPTPHIPNISSINIAREKNDIESTSNKKSMEKPKNNATLKRKRAVKTEQPNKRNKGKNVRKRNKGSGVICEYEYEDQPYIECDDSSIQVPKEIQQEIELIECLVICERITDSSLTKLTSNI